VGKEKTVPVPFINDDGHSYTRTIARTFFGNLDISFLLTMPTGDKK